MDFQRCISVLQGKIMNNLADLYSFYNFSYSPLPVSRSLYVHICVFLYYSTYTILYIGVLQSVRVLVQKCTYCCNKIRFINNHNAGRKKALGERRTPPPCWSGPKLLICRKKNEKFEKNIIFTTCRKGIKKVHIEIFHACPPLEWNKQKRKQ